MSTLKRRDVERALAKKGFARDNNDHRYFWLYVEGQKTGIFTKTSHSHKDISDGLVATMASQVKLSVSSFRELVGCKISGTGYLEILTEEGETP